MQPYVKALKSIKNAGVRIHACSHITGGGFYENVPRMLKEGTRAIIEKDSYPVLPIFKLLAEKGDIEEKMMYNTYNMGLGMVLAVNPADVEKTMEAIQAYPVLPIFKLLAEKGDIEEKMMYNTYNMGLGMVLAVNPADVEKTMEAIQAAGDKAYVVGRIEDPGSWR